MTEKKRGLLIAMVSKAAKIHPKSVPRSFRRVQLSTAGDEDRRGRRTYYGKDVDAALFDVWEAANRPCGELVFPIIGSYVDIFVRDKMWHHSDEATGKLRAMSERTMKRRTRGFQKKYGDGRGRSSTSPSSLKHIIPIFKGPWDNLPPGNGQLDTVAHCGNTLLGDFVYTLNYTDAVLYWGVRRAQWNKGAEATTENLEYIRTHLPFPLLMGHPDTGSEFINWVGKAWFEKHGIAFTRSEPGKKNDNMYVEERNGHIVRKYLGYGRFDVREIVPLTNEYYVVLDLYLNHFQAVRRTLTKERVGSAYKRTFEKRGKTPYERLMAHEAIATDVKERVLKEHEALNPLLLKRQLDTLREKIYKLQKASGHETEKGQTQ